MSEFSESYHLRSERSEDAIDLLRRAKLKGYVFPPTNGWVTFLAENGAFKPNPQLVQGSRHPLLHFVSAEDHGWGFSLFHQGKPACSYKCEWDPGLAVDDARYSRDVLQELLPSADTILLEEVERDMRPRAYDDLIGAELSKTFARAVGLEHYDWIAYHYIERDFRFSKDRRPDVIIVT
jgi:hypothetical protein